MIWWNEAELWVMVINLILDFSGFYNEFAVDERYYAL